MLLAVLGVGPLPLFAHYDKRPVQDLHIYVDPTHSLSLNDAQERDRRGEFQSRAALGRNGLGFTDATVWMRFKAVVPYKGHDVYVLSPRPDFTTMDIYLLDPEGQLLTVEPAGTKNPDRSLKKRLPAARFSGMAPGLHTFYVKVRSPLQLSLTLYLLNHDEYDQVLEAESGFYLIYYGTVIGLLLYNFFLFLVLRRSPYLFYIAFGLSMLLNAYAQGGFTEVSAIRIVGLNSVEDAVRVLFLPSLTSLLFTHSFLNLKVVSPLLSRLVFAIAFLAALFQLAIWIDPSLPIKQFSSCIDLIAVLFVFVGSTIAIRQGDKVAAVFLLAWGVLALSVGYWILGNLGVIEKSFYVAFSPLAGNMIEMVLMSLALAIRIRNIEERSLIAEMQAKEKDNLQHLLRIISHDIMNPLSVVKSAVYVYKRSPERAEVQMNRIDKASRSIEAIIQQVRKYDAFRSGKLSLVLTPCSVRKTFDDILFYFSETATEKSIELICVMPDEDLWVMANEVALTHEVLNNVVSNAIKFTNAGGWVRISAKASALSVEITVEDNGIGIPKKHLSSIFHANHPTTRQGTQDEAGSGFGMPLVKTFVEKFEGEVHIHSTELEPSKETQHGTTVTITLKRTSNP